MTSAPIDWVDVWDGLHGSRDMRAIIEAGAGLREAVAKARRLWHERDLVHADVVRRLEVDRDQAFAELDVLNGECASLADVVRSWHEAEHFEPWLVCPNVPCRAASIEFPSAVPHVGLDLVLGVAR